MRRMPEEKQLTTQFILCGVFELQGLCARDSCVGESIFRGVPLGIIESIGGSSTAEGIADGHGSQAEAD